MPRHYCTLFDKNYLYQGLALHDSLVATTHEFKLYALAMDEVAFEMLEKLDRESLVPVSIEDMLTDDVRVVRQKTTHGQFCWVNQPLICQYLLEHHGLDMVTYLESDSYFFSDPEQLFEELGTYSVSLVPHNFSSGIDNTVIAGRFCVQFNAFRNDNYARAVLADWRKENFGYDKSEPKLYPGQTSIDSWPIKFPGVKVIENPGAGVAPWNVSGYKLGQSNGVPTVDGMPVVFYHYHQYGRFVSGAHELGSYPMSEEVVDLFYRPYVNALRRAERAVSDIDPSFNFRRQYPDSTTLRDLLRAPSIVRFASLANKLKRHLRRRYNVYPDAFFGDGASKNGGVQ